MTLNSNICWMVMKETSLILKRSNKMFSTTRYGNPESHANFTSADCRKEPFFKKGQKH